ncbi:FAD-dependent oxidoreductase [Streptomyces sp. NPDC002994]|uniref:FAD-dependent oxidoreductase n=1 Tax=Streptomyces sp. NPDC002994 TaxID=3154441 RepID=UPI0033A1FED5
MSAGRILVVGAGIGGLATALSVAARGNRVTVLERRNDFAEPGAGTQLSPNAFHALERIGVDGAVRERAVFVDELRLMDATTGERIAGMPLKGRYEERFGNGYAVLHRGELHSVLLDACRAAGGIELVPGQSVTWYDQTADRVTAVTDTGRRFTGSALIAADGIRSAVRRQLVGDGGPRASGHTIYHSVVPLADIADDRLPPDLSPGSVTAWVGPGRHIVHFIHRAADGTRYLNLGATRDHGAQEALVGLPLDQPHVLGEFPAPAESVRRLLELGQEWRTWVLCDRDPVAGWTDGRVALLGNAAHPMLPYAVQGVSMTLEDAAALGELLDCDGRDMAQRLEKYNAVRRARTARTQLVARELGTRLLHPAGEAAAERDAMLTALTADELHDRVAWLHGKRDFTDSTNSTEGAGN